jgi:hypothetical protein
LILSHDGTGETTASNGNLADSYRAPAFHGGKDGWHDEHNVIETERIERLNGAGAS